ncbi:hypothetical protein OG455_30985 [Kitasatospora sp. NBC_01287]|uniref:hypothetical protein n=1 Tax=Kitasatospora sp. NBC_01287 TaxID=2903573 RepID=UPI00225AC750|nr:hypothetical protein [Kitasatospora sp. NBC_01287]MCX4749890.1 hypothetical protein [Kitasatospora sp. NBC_01287]
MSNLRRIGTLAASGAAVLAFATACGSSGSSSSGSAAGSPAPSMSAPAPSSATPATPPPAGSSAPALKVTTDPKLGQIVTDSNGFTLYRFDQDSASPPKSTCDGSCATLWPAAVAPAQPTGSGVNAAMIGTLTRADGTKQLTLNGWPLYRYMPDTKPGDTNGEGVGGVWFAATPTGGKAMPATTAPSSPSSPSSGGTSGGGY